MKKTRSIKTCQKIFIRHNTDENRQLQAESGHHLLDQCDHILITTGPSVWYVCSSGSVWSKIIVTTEAETLALTCAHVIMDSFHWTGPEST